MRILEVRRHSNRQGNSDNLSQAGVSLANKVGRSMGQFNRVITSTAQRSFQTALAMGYAPHGQLEELNPVGTTIQWDAGFASFASLRKQGGPTVKMFDVQGQLWQMIINSISEGGAVLVITHGGIVEMGAVACMPHSNHATWGAYVDYCEGVRLTYDGVTFTKIEILRI